MHEYIVQNLWKKCGIFYQSILVFLPPYCPFLNPIEDVWKDIKRELYISDYETLDELIDLFISLFYEIVDNISYYKNWLFEFFNINLW